MVEYTQGPVSDYQPQIAPRTLWARGVTAAIGLWLLISAFIWPHADASFTNTWVVGLGIFLSGLWALRDPFARWVTAGLGVWMFLFTIIAWHSSVATIWNNALVACAAIALALVPNEATRRRSRRAR